MTPQQIRDAIAASPALQAHAAAGNTQAIADALSTGWETQTVEVEAWRAMRYFIKRGKWRGLLEAADNPLHPAKAAAIAAVDLASAANMLIDFADPAPETQGMWALLVGHSLCSVADRDEIQSWCKVKRIVTHTQVGEALKGA